MTGRQRLQALLNRQPTDRLAWTTLVDGITRSVMPESVRGLASPEFCRHIGCDILQFGNYDLPADCRVISPARLVRPESGVRATTDADGVRTTVTCTAWGDLTATHKGSHPLKHPVTTREELRVLRNLWAESHYEEVEGHEASFARAEAFLGDDGLYLPTLEPSPVQQLLELDMGVIGFYHLLADYPREVEELLEIMQAARVQEYELLCRRTPAPAIIPVENTSSTLISP